MTSNTSTLPEDDDYYNFDEDNYSNFDVFNNNVDEDDDEEDEDNDDGLRINGHRVEDLEDIKEYESVS